MRILGTGRATGSREIATEVLDGWAGLRAGTLERKTGMRRRLLTAPDQDQLDLANEAISRAFQDAACTHDSIDMIISAAAVPYQPIPNLSSLIAKSIGAFPSQVETMDINSTCLSFVSALNVANLLLEARQRKRILIVSSEIASRGLPFESDPETASIFGDGAAACIIERGGGRVLSFDLKTYPEAWNACQLKSGGTGLKPSDPEFETGAMFNMQGKELFKLTRKKFPAFLQALMDKSGIAKSDVDLVIPHQASPMALKHISGRLGFRKGAVVDIVADTGNQIAASIPFTLDYARKSGLLKDTKHVALLGTSAGVSFGGMVLKGCL